MTTNYVITTAKGWKYDVRAYDHADAELKFFIQYPFETVASVLSESEAIQRSLDKGRE